MQGDRATAPSAKPKPPKPKKKAPPKQSAAGASADGQRWAAKATDVTRKTYEAKTPTQRKASVAAARSAGGKRTRAQRDILAAHGERSSAAGQARGALARRFDNPEAKRALAILAAAQAKKDDKDDGDGGHGLGGIISHVFHKVYGGGGDAKGGGEATSRAGSLGGAEIASATGGGLYTIPKNVGIVLASDPKKQIPKLGGDTAKSVASIPAGLVALGLHPKKTIEATGKDYGRRYGALAGGDEKAFRERMKKEGVAPEVFDIASAASVGGAAVGKGLQTAARAGRLGEAAERIATERPNIRVSGNVSKEQPIHDNLARNVVSAGRDAARRKVQTRRASQESAPLEVRQAQAQGEVTHIRKRATRSAQQKAVAGAKGRRLTALKAEGQREQGAARKNIHSLSKTERRALNYAMKFGIHDAETARREIPQWIERVKAQRAEHEATTGKSIPSKQNEVPELEFLLAHADEAFTPNTARVAQEEGARAARVGAEDPGFDNSVADRRRHMAQAEFTGEARPLSKAEAQAHVREAKSAVTEAEKQLRRAHGDADVRAAEDALDEARAAAQRAAHVKADGGYVVRVAKPAAREVTTDKIIKLRTLAERGATEGERAAAKAKLRSAVRDGAGTTEHHVVTADELEAAHLPRIVEAARQRGLQEPHYTVSEKRPAGAFSAFAAGGKKAVQGSKRYEGSLLRTGRENTDPEAHLLSLQKGVKRKHNWNLVADTFEEHAAHEPELRHQTLDELRDELDRRGIDPDSVAFWNPGRYKAERQHFDKHAGGGDADIEDPTFESRNVQDAIGESTLDDLDSAGSQFKGTTGWSVIPRAVYDEIHADVKPSGKIGRTYDIARGKVSRLLLGNPAWLQFQVASNGLMTGLAGVGPVDAIKAQRWWKNLSTAERDAIEPYVGVHNWYDDQRHLGAAANGRMVNAYRAFKTTTFYRLAHKGNPLDLLFRADNAQNNFFRKAVFYNRVKREAYKNMGREAGKAIKSQQRIVDTILARTPEEAMAALLKDGRTIEKHAQAVNDFLGNWTTYTARERRTFSRSVMFYGFMRFSVKLAFYTMPIEHPLLSSILLHLGHLQNDELEKLFGGDMPAWEIGSYYDHGRKFNAARLNPFFNALQYQGPGQLAGSLGPLAGVVIDQVAAKNVGFDKLFTVDGSTRYVQKGKDLSLADRLNIAASELEKVSPYARMAERYTLKNRQTSDSWLLHPRDTGSPGLGEKSHDLGDVLREGLAPIATEDGRPALRAAKQSNPKVSVQTGSANGPDAPPALPPLPALPAVPETITIQVR